MKDSVEMNFRVFARFRNYVPRSLRPLHLPLAPPLVFYTSSLWCVLNAVHRLPLPSPVPFPPSSSSSSSSTLHKH